MKERSFIAVYWGARKQDVDGCAKQISDFLVKIRDFDKDAFSQWFGKGWSKEEALEKKIDITNIEQIKKTLLEGMKPDEIEFCDIGYRLSFWNGKDSLEGMSIDFHVGEYGGYSPNLVLIEFPFSGPVHDKYKNRKDIVELTKFIANFWEAEQVRINEKKMSKEEFEKI